MHCVCNIKASDFTWSTQYNQTKIGLLNDAFNKLKKPGDQKREHKLKLQHKTIAILDLADINENNA